MSLAESSLPPGPPVPPPLPEGWRYTEEVDGYDDFETARRRRFVLLVAGAVAVAVVAAVVLLLLVLNAQRHYAQGVAALDAGRYAAAAGEFSAARLVFFSYRDADSLGEQARQGLLSESRARERAAARTQAVNAALDEAAAALDAGSAARVLAALGAVSAADLRRTLRDDSAATRQAETLEGGLTVGGRRALGAHQWARAALLAEALALLAPASEWAGTLAAKAAAGEKLEARMDEARAAARAGAWRKALRVALAVRAAHDGFPGASSLIAQARDALRPPPAPEPAATAIAAPSTDTGGGTSSGGSSSQPPPP